MMNWMYGRQIPTGRLRRYLQDQYSQWFIRLYVFAQHTLGDSSSVCVLADDGATWILARRGNLLAGSKMETHIRLHIKRRTNEPRWKTFFGEIMCCTVCKQRLEQFDANKSDFVCGLVFRRECEPT